MLFSSSEPKALGELIVWDSSRRPSVCPCVSPCVRASTLSNMNISEIGWPIIIKFHQKHHWGGGLTALGFRLDRIRTLVSMATDSSHRVIMGENLVTTPAPSFLICSSLFLQVIRTIIKSRMGSKFGRIEPGTYELAALEPLEKSP